MLPHMYHEMPYPGRPPTASAVKVKQLSNDLTRLSQERDVLDSERGEWAGRVVQQARMLAQEAANL